MRSDAAGTWCFDGLTDLPVSATTTQASMEVDYTWTVTG